MDTGCYIEDLLRAMAERDDDERESRESMLSAWLDDDEDDNSPNFA